MISVYKIRPQFQRMLTPVLEFLHRRGVTANQITLAGCVLSLLIAVAFWCAQYSSWFFLALPVGLFVRMALNALDGMMARRFNQCSPLGELLNELGDVLSDAVVFLPLLLFFPQAMWAVVVFMLLSVVNEMAGLLGRAMGGERRFEGPMGKSDRALLLALIGVLMACGVNLAPYALWIFVLADALLLLSSYLRARRSLPS